MESSANTDLQAEDAHNGFGNSSGHPGLPFIILHTITHSLNGFFALHRMTIH